MYRVMGPPPSLEHLASDVPDGFLRGEQSIVDGDCDLAEELVITVTAAGRVERTKGTGLGVDELILHQDDERGCGIIVLEQHGGLQPFCCAEATLLLVG